MKTCFSKAMATHHLNQRHRATSPKLAAQELGNCVALRRLELKLTIKHNQVNPGQFLKFSYSWELKSERASSDSNFCVAHPEDEPVRHLRWGKTRFETLHQLIRTANWNWRALWADLISPNCEYGVTPSRL